MVFTRGIERIRTAVQGFADLCLATRPQCHLTDGKCNKNIALNPKDCFKIIITFKRSTF